MIIYNVTVNIDFEAHDAWLAWMRSTHIPDVIKTGCFIESRLSKVVTDQDQGGVTYSIQYLAKTEADYQNYLDNHAAALQQEHTKKYAGKFAAFRTLLHVVEQFN